MSALLYMCLYMRSALHLFRGVKEFMFGLSIALTLCSLISHSQAETTTWRENGEDNDCVFYKGDREGDIIPVKAICQWTVSAKKLHKALGRARDYDLYFSSVASSDPIDAPTGIQRVLQRHVHSGMSDRAVYLDYTRGPIKGGTRYSYKKAKIARPLPKDHIEIELIRGYWEVRATPSGAHLTFVSRYAAGGSIPDFLVRWFMTSGVKEMIGELKKYVS
jgi:hypothetical protein